MEMDQKMVSTNVGRPWSGEERVVPTNGLGRIGGGLPHENRLGKPLSVTEWQSWPAHRKIAWVRANIEVRTDADAERYLRQIEDMIHVGA
jgi:hypothetical protein